MGQELINRGAGGQGMLWSADALINRPEVVLEIHRDYIQAGADIITTNSYSTIRDKFEPAGLMHRFEEMNRLAGQLAVQAREQSGRSVLIAGSLPPQRGSYRPDQVGSFDEIEPLYREQADLLAPYVDLFICETMSSCGEALAAATAAVRTGMPVWVSWTMKDRGEVALRSGESLAQAVEALAGTGVSALLVNCSAPEALGKALPELIELTDGPVGIYANAFTPIPEHWDYDGDHSLPPPREDLGPDAYAQQARKWIRGGARIIGGCCEIGPEHIRRLDHLLREAVG